MRYRIMAASVLWFLSSTAAGAEDLRRIITTTGTGIQEFEPDWANLTLQIRLRGNFGDNLNGALQHRADSIVGRLAAGASESCSVILGPARKWNECIADRRRDRYKCVGAEIAAQVFVSGREACRNAERIVGEYQDCILSPRDVGLFHDSAAVRSVNELAIQDALQQAENSTAVAGVLLGDLQSLILNPIESASLRSLYDQVHGQGQSQLHRERLKVIRRAVAIATHEIKQDL